VQGLRRHAERPMKPLICGLVLLGAATTLVAQATRPSAPRPLRPPAKSCTLPDSTKDWFSRQRAWWALDQQHDWSDDTLRTSLLAAAARLAPAAASGFPVQLGVEVVGASLQVPDNARGDVEAARARLRDMAKNRRWPVRSLVGSAGVHAAWLLASGDSALAA